MRYCSCYNRWGTSQEHSAPLLVYRHIRTRTHNPRKPDARCRVKVSRVWGERGREEPLCPAAPDWAHPQCYTQACLLRCVSQQNIHGRPFTCGGAALAAELISTVISQRMRSQAAICSSTPSICRTVRCSLAARFLIKHSCAGKHSLIFCHARLTTIFPVMILFKCLISPCNILVLNPYPWSQDICQTFHWFLS